MLEVRDLVVRYGSAVALDGVSLEVHEGEMVALVGSNGAGKTTLVNAISGMLPVAAGSIRLEGSVSQVPEGRQLFGDLSVEDNLRLGGWISGRRDPAHVYELFPKLRDLRRRPAWTLSGGEQQMLAVGRALMAEPRLLAVADLTLRLAPLPVSELARPPGAPTPCPVPAILPHVLHAPPAPPRIRRRPFPIRAFAKHTVVASSITRSAKNSRRLPHLIAT